MRWNSAPLAVIALCSSATAQERPSTETLPSHFEIARHYFLDFGPPHDFYELFLVRTKDDQTLVDRITLTPVADKCYAPATVEVKSAMISEDIPTLLGETSPCKIPEKELRRELKRCKRCMVFSGANVTMQFECGGQPRLIRSDILDRDMFDPAPQTPDHASWTMHLLGQLDTALGPGVLDKPMFAMSSKGDGAQTELDPDTAREISAGKYDALFPKAPDKPSAVYRQAQIRPPSPTVQLVSSGPIAPRIFVPPMYPPITLLAHLEGEVLLSLEVDENGVVINVTLESGHPALQRAVSDAAYAWRFPEGNAGREIHATVKFALNCQRSTD
jgi:TonB family protein